ncbi:alanine racemase [Clostridium sp. N3C]|uniref:YggS family pyridoxal phosphate-dependent enzyme n=1 Tax=Clostridium sp. N3C TaxID=1776758 RepID=UPI00092DF482|nr:YggS family pyridoxal phosphate-dependent enzyme [Clostridium sp. N3C]SCN21350.1 alanine racemase [Clostridium sp. N3C]
MSIAENIQSLRNKITKDVTVIAVSKTRTIEEMQVAYDCGFRDFAESKVQELTLKQENFHKDVRWHFIGHLQRNKVKYIAGKVFLIHSLDSIRLLKEIEKQYEKLNLTANVLIEINIGREESKSGILVEELDELIKEVGNCNYVKVMGIMTVLPKGDEKSNREYFRQVKEIFDKLDAQKPKNVVMQYLSMGMTGDFIEAIEEGSNMIRIGEGIFGKRNYNKQ